MSYRGTTCNCGQSKLTETLICDQCWHDLRDTPAFKSYHSTRFRPEMMDTHRRSCINLLNASRELRKKRAARPTYSVTYRKPATGFLKILTETLTASPSTKKPVSIFDNPHKDYLTRIRKHYRNQTKSA